MFKNEPGRTGSSGKASLPKSAREAVLGSPLDRIRAVTGTDEWKETRRGFELDLRGKEVLFSFARNLRFVCDYQYGCLTERRVALSGHTFKPEEGLFEVMSKFEPMTEGRQGLVLPRPEPGYCKDYFRETIQHGGQLKSGKFGGPGHFATSLHIEKHLAEDPSFMRVLSESEAVKGALVPILEQL